jgi:hypothetical protein
VVPASVSPSISKWYPSVSVIILSSPAFTQCGYQTALLCLRAKKKEEVAFALPTLSVTNIAYAVATLALGFRAKFSSIYTSNDTIVSSKARTNRNFVLGSVPSPFYISIFFHGRPSCYAIRRTLGFRGPSHLSQRSSSRKATPSSFVH